MVKLLHGDCLEQMKTLADNSIDAVVTDPPYGLAFMGKKWDYDVPKVDVWREAIRVLKPGGHLLSFGGTRTYHRMVVAIEDAGFEIRDQLQWIYGSGFPKSHNIKDGEFKGWGTALKPANEPIVLARKPLEGTVAQNIAKWGVGGLNIDGCRIGTDKIKSAQIDTTSWHGNSFGAKPQKQTGEIKEYVGRWPANVLLDEDAAEMLDEQSGVSKSAKTKTNDNRKNDGNSIFLDGFHSMNNSHCDSGGASRFFYVAKTSKRERNAGLDDEIKEKQGARPNSADPTGKFPDHDHRKTGGNNHPTVKPIKLMQHLCTLITPPNGTILDPFMGSGSTGIAAKNLGFKFIGIEMNEEYIEIAKRRIGSDPEPKAEE